MTCPRCHKTLTAPASIKRGMGRTCKAHEIAEQDEARQFQFDFPKEGIMRGIIYRLGTRIKDFAEGIKSPIARWLGIPAALQLLGYAMRDLV